MEKCVLLLEDDPDLARLVRELLHEHAYNVIQVATVDELLLEATRRSPCVALVDSTDSKSFDLWSLGPKLSQLGVPPVAFTAHNSAKAEFEADPHDFAGIISKPFDADEFLTAVDSICWEEHQAAVS